MKQLLIVNSTKAINANYTGGSTVTGKDLSGLDEGAISFFELGSDTVLSAAPTKNFGIALGRGKDKVPFIIPEVDIKTLSITKALPKAGKACTATVMFKNRALIPKVNDYVLFELTFIKKGALPHERNRYSFVSYKPDVQNLDIYYPVLRDELINSSIGQYFDISLDENGPSSIKCVCKNIGEQWIVILGDAFVRNTQSSDKNVDPEPTIGDKAYIQDLASRCAAGKGFNNTEQSGQDLIPGYPENVEDLVPNTSGTGGVSTAGYAVYTLRFKVGRDSAKTRDERVWQLVHIAVPITNASYATIDAILPEGDFYSNMMNANAATAASAAVAAAAGSNG